MPATKTELRRVSVRAHDTELHCDTLRGVGFSWRCTCGARGKVWQTRSAALWGKREHEEWHLREPRPAPLAGAARSMIP